MTVENYNLDFKLIRHILYLKICLVQILIIQYNNFEFK